MIVEDSVEEAAMAKFILAGPPRSGKSCLREGLKQAIRAIPGAPYPYVITACPDGEGSWFQETVNLDPSLARELKEAYKAKFTPEFVVRVEASVRNCTLPLTLVDIGGIPSAENRTMVASATHAVLLAGDPSRLPEWREFCKNLGLSVVAEIRSDYHGTEDVVEDFGPDGVLRGSVHHLERGEPVSSRPMVAALANLLVRLANGGE
jgi:CRISPR-associated protein Csx3